MVANALYLIELTSVGTADYNVPSFQQAKEERL
jgi:hypothetical protein